ncbi:hypothetical protein [Sphingomonas alpina]|uniref:Uncharacterized protein n=1 Tax=Sphingomonas alpina TaxID=653931 RepID=A0A7H0LFD0_9SPHN|nr:hypothetical protein [Sphingomonas alpina]QNQ08383.1 hypothetical protein H3Z74_16730 [Sphingomonas alpina]
MNHTIMSPPDGDADRSVRPRVVSRSSESAATRGAAPFSGEEEAEAVRAQALRCAAALSCRQLRRAIEQLFARTAAAAGVSIESARLAAHYSPAQLRRMTGARRTNGLKPTPSGAAS